MTIPRLDSALILAAGLGTRMEDLTKTTPKPLLMVWGKTLLDHILSRVVQAGITRVMVNTHYLPDQIKDHVTAWKSHIRDLIIWHEEVLLDTGGAIVRAASFKEKAPFFVINGDVLWRERAGNALLAMKKAWEAHPTFTLALIAKEQAWGYTGNGDFFFDAQSGHVQGKRNKHQIAPYVYGGIQIVNPRYTETDLLARVRLSESFAANHLWNLAMQDDALRGYLFPDPWYHIGTKEAYRQICHI